MRSPIPALSKRRSSDSTVGVWDSPQQVPEGLKTDEEDYLGRGNGSKNRVDVSTQPLVLSATSVDSGAGEGAGGGGGGRKVELDSAGSGDGGDVMRILADTTLTESMASVTLGASASSTTVGDGGEEKGLDGTGSGFGGEALHGRHGGGGSGASAAASATSCCAESVDDNSSTRLGSFYLPGALHVGGHHRDDGHRDKNIASAISDRQDDAARSDCAAVGVGGFADADVVAARVAPRAGKVESAWEADSEVVLAPAEPPAAAVATVISEGLPTGPVEREVDAGLGLDAGDAGGDDNNDRSPEKTGGEAPEMERRGSMLDVYREPEPCAQESDWGELDDWQGLPGLGLGATGIGSGGGSSFQVRMPWWFTRDNMGDEDKERRAPPEVSLGIKCLRYHLHCACVSI